MLEITLNFFQEFWTILCEMSPYLLLGFIVAGILSLFFSERFVRKHFGGKGFSSIVKSTLTGIPLPLCSCGVIPVGASLRRQGASRGATASFLLSTPQTGVDSILVTYSLLGPVFALFRPIAALITGLAGGVLINLTTDDDAIRSPDHRRSKVPVKTETGNPLGRALHYGFVMLPKDIGKTLIWGLAAAGIISAAVPDNLFASVFTNNILTMLAMIAVSVPMYVCATASVPIAAALIVKGISPGAALVFLLTGPATNAATIATVGRILGKGALFVYLLIVVLSAVLSGLMIDWIFSDLPVPGMSVSMNHEMHWIKWGSAIVLIAVLAHAMFRGRGKREDLREFSSDSISETIAVRGMSCSHCARSLQEALQEIPGVDSVDVNLKNGQAVVRGASYSRDQLLQTIRDLGFQSI